MNKTIVKELLVFLVGASIGGVGTWLVTKSHYKNFADSEIAEMKEHYQKKLAEELEKAKAEYLAPGEEIIDDEEEAEELKKILAEKKALAKKNHDKPNIVDYTRYYVNDGEKPSVETSLAEMEHPKDSDEDDGSSDEEENLVEDEFSEPDPEVDDHEEENYRAGIEMMEEDKRNSDKEPFIFSEEEFYSDMNRHSTESLFYYEGNDILLNERDEPVENREWYVGNCLEEDGWDESGVMYVRNNKYKIDYEITLVKANYEG